MTILSPQGLTTEYSYQANTLTRIVDGKPRILDLKENDSMKQVARISSLDNETFKQFALVQQELRELKGIK